MRAKSITEPKENGEFYPFSHYYIFGYVMENYNDVAKKLISIVLNKKVRKVVCNKAEYGIKSNFECKSIRLDIYFEDDNSVYDVEMQVYSDRALGKRCRYYQSSLDTNTFKEGQKYYELKNSYIIFLCLFDPFDNDQYEQKPIQAINTFEMLRTDDPTCKVGDALKLQTAAQVTICNTLAYEKTSGNLHDLLQYIATQKVENNNSFIKKIDDIVRQANKNEDIRRAAKMFDMKFMEAQQIGEQRGMKIGEQRGMEIGKEEERQRMYNAINSDKSLTDTEKEKFIKFMQKV